MMMRRSETKPLLGKIKATFVEMCSRKDLHLDLVPSRDSESSAEFLLGGILHRSCQGPVG
jgi:hypothetical protein